jgi:hypothetical protein
VSGLLGFPFIYIKTTCCQSEGGHTSRWMKYHSKWLFLLLVYWEIAYLSCITRSAKYVLRYEKNILFLYMPFNGFLLYRAFRYTGLVPCNPSHTSV